MSTNQLLEARGKAALIFGAASGIGAAAAEAYASAGGQVMSADLAPQTPSSRVAPIECDVTDEASVGAAFAACVQQFGRIDAVVHSVGVPSVGPLASLSLADWRRVMDINLTSAFLVARAAWPHLKASGGAAVFVASTSCRNGGATATGPTYAASKGGMINLTRYLAREWAADGIRVNAVAPGPVMTPLMASVDPERRAAYAKALLTGRLIEAEELGAAIAFLLSDHARSITGAVLNQSGGLVLD